MHGNLETNGTEGILEARRGRVLQEAMSVGDVIRSFPVRSVEGERSRRLRLYFDSGSPYTFIKRSAAAGFRNLFTLAKPQSFGGLGNGRFTARGLLHIEVRLLGIWCRHAAYVIDEGLLEPDVDALVGHDFMQKFDVNIASRKKDLILNRASLKRAQVVRSARRPGYSTRSGVYWIQPFIISSNVWSP
jgi:hypothetical protein